MDKFPRPLAICPGGLKRLHREVSISSGKKKKKRPHPLEFRLRDTSWGHSTVDAVVFSSSPYQVQVR
jgi:hypothetical protein